MQRATIPILLIALTPVYACRSETSAPAPATDTEAESGREGAAESTGERLMAKYTPFRLEVDLSHLSESQRAMLPLLIEAAEAMEEVFWRQAYGDPEPLLAGIADPELRRFAEINYGPWDRLDGNRPFLEGVGPKPLGAAFYPPDMSKEELERAAASSEQAAAELRGLYTLVRRDGEGALTAIPYSEAYSEAFGRAAEKLRRAAELAEDEGFRRYLELRAEALLADDYLASDLAWMEMKDNDLDLVIGPIETYEDQLFGAKAAAEAYVLLKDRKWSARLARYAEMLPALQRGLPVEEAYKAEEPGTDSDLGAYDVLYYAGDCNAGSKTIAINLPNDERVQLERGTRRLQLKNAMRAKFDEILVPIGDELIAEEQRPNITFEAFFANTMFHEVAHGLGIKETITGKGTVRSALQEHASALEEGKADVLGLYMVTELDAAGELGEGAELEDNYVTFLASIFRSVRFGSASAHGVANLIRFHFFQEQGAFRRDPETGTYRVDFERMQAAMAELSGRILRLQGDGDHEAVRAFVERYGGESAELRADLDRLESAGIPVDIVFEQGLGVLLGES